MSGYKIGVLVGSLRKDSLNLKLAKALTRLAPPELSFAFIEIGDLPFYNQDLETDMPPTAWTRYRDELKTCAGLLFLTPEYNRSFSGVLKNAIDVGSRPYGQGAINGRPSAVISVSPGALGAFGANHHLRQTLAGVAIPVMPAPEAYIGNAGALFAEDGSIKVESTRDFVATFAKAFAAWVEKNAKK